MSGGNQQKVIVAREISRPIKAAILSQPTRGVDVGSIEYIHERIIALRDAGVAVLVVSTELDEVMALADRVLVMFDHRIVADLERARTNHNEVGLYMAGATPTRGRARRRGRRTDGRRVAAARRVGRRRRGSTARRSRMTDVAVPESTSQRRKPRAVERLEEFDAKNAVLVPVLAVISALVVGAIVVGVTDIERLKHRRHRRDLRQHLERLQGAVRRRVRQLVGHQRDDRVRHAR